MSGDKVHIPTSSQTVGPYFRIGLEYMLGLTPQPAEGAAGTIELRGQVLDRDGAPVPDAMLEFWDGGTGVHLKEDFLGRYGIPAGFRRAATDEDGAFSVSIERPWPAADGQGAPHLLVLIFARGLLRNLISRVYFGDESTNESDNVLRAVPEERRSTLIARRDRERAGLYIWDVILQGSGETVFFAW